MCSSVEYNMTHMAKANSKQQLSNYLHILYIHILKFYDFIAPISSMQLPEICDIVNFTS